VGVQEVLLAKQAYLLCGDIVLPYGNFVQSVWPDPAMAMANAELYPYVRYDLSFKEHGCTMEFCIAKYSSKACDNPRDKVYGLLGLVPTEEQVPIEYRKSVLVVYLDAVKVLASYMQLDHIRCGRPPFFRPPDFLP
jgi:hypothetical protein